jgi:hypothetical protein
MHRLRIELGGKGQNFLARDVAWSESAEMAGRKIFEGKRHQGDCLGDCCEGGLIVAVICSNLNPSARMARAPRASTAVCVLVPDLARDDIRS